MKDVPFIALAVAISNDDIWTEDKHFIKQKIIKIMKNKNKAINIRRLNSYL